MKRSELLIRHNGLTAVTIEAESVIGIAVTGTSLWKGFIHHQFLHFLWCLEQYSRPLPPELLLMIHENVRGCCLGDGRAWIKERDFEVRQEALPNFAKTIR